MPGAGGVPVPAHINRTSNSLLYSLGFLPPELCFTALEVYAGLPVRKEQIYYVSCPV